MLRKKRVVIVSGGELHSDDIQRINREHDWIIAADGGARKLMAYGIWPNLLVGDMDTLGNEELKLLEKKKITIERLPSEKDVTDTHYACEKALTYQPDEVVLFGVWGGARMDHAIANIGLLEWIEERGTKAIIYAGSNRVRMVQGPTRVVLKKESFQYLSLLPISEKVVGIDTVGLKYTLKDGSLKRGLTRGVSNELIAERAEIQIRQGKVLLIEASD